MYIDDEEKKIKLDSGYGVTYPTGVIHRVNQVTSGERIVLVFWTKSIFKDPTLREICSELSSIKLKTEEERLIQPSPNFEDVVHQNSFKLTNILNKIIRTYGDI
jgi:predicted 2-oxoglutarate/Fe(II)-dependent dioxygenase YbiX